MLQNIPAELRALPQWVAVDMSINAETGQPKKLPIDPKTNRYASPVDPSTWGTFEQASGTGRPVGFVFTDADPYAVIDLDNKPHKPATPEQLAVHNAILTGVESYIERSISKTGYHAVVKGSIPAGVNFGNVEMYSSGRYMIFTGDVVKNAPIDDYHDAINQMYVDMRACQERVRQKTELVQVDGHMEDGDIFTMAGEAANYQKFNDLCAGRWQHYGFPSQSEADLALMSMFAFYSKDNEQCRRLFRMTELGKRDKYSLQDTAGTSRLNRMLEMIRSKEPQPVNLVEVEEKVAAVKAELAAEEARAAIVATPEPEPEPSQEAPAIPTSIKGPMLDVFQPPGVLQLMTEHIYASSPRQVREYAVIASIAMLAGMSSRAYNINGTGLNQYLIMLGGPGTGKEAMASGIGKLTKAMNSGILDAKPVDIGTFASVQGIHKALLNQPCGLSILGEVGHEFKIMLSPKCDPNRLEIKKAYLNLYAKSGDGESYSPVTYSKSENNMAAVASPNLSILGESTPLKFYESINEASSADGFLSRLMVLEYTGPRPDLNSKRPEPSKELVSWLCAIRDHSADLQARSVVENVKVEPMAQAMLDEYDREITRRINRPGVGAGESELLVRSHLKVLRLAALGAVAINHYTPVVTQPLVEWAIAFVNYADSTLTTRFASGEIGEVGDVQMEPVIVKAIKAYFKMTAKQRKDLRQPEVLCDTNFVGYSFLRHYCKMREPFKSHKLGYAKAIEIAIEDMVKAGILVKVMPGQMPPAKNGQPMVAYTLGENF